MSNPYVGILVNDSLFAGIPLGNTQYEAIHFYEDAGKLYGLTPCYFRIHDVHMKTMKVYAYVKDGQHFKRKWSDLPKVIHNRAIYLDSSSARTLEAWTRQGVTLFNRWNRYSKMRIHEILMKNESIRPHLPCTFPATIENVKAMMDSFDTLIIKPTNSSIGRGVMKLERQGNLWKLLYPVNMKLTNRTWRTLKFRQHLPKLLRRRIVSSSYMVQQCLPLATVDGSPFDLRISVQRGTDGSWGVTGMIAKVASRKHFLTNVAQGGKVKSLTDILNTHYPQLDPKAVCLQMTNFALLVAQHLSTELPNLADLGLDIAMTNDGFPLFIECNGKDQRYSFREANMQECWKATYFNPMAYAKFILDGGTPPC
ncbi:Endospore coat-associated protein YheD [Paenibacillus allorhizoplanae]|uniref:Endospore coat-associated protein YheD n=1 Tax=Paenibacillus allorhizoplanae TaxID=2905648 RepID=A0ABM9D0F7_9BACL|nr:YheC/YheD family protein [Paenibacillus allorhizoplanae]CAH1229962.1 Endospore coat-associated protein YheD [Paenibacillus allorhizoplanae]